MSDAKRAQEIANDFTGRLGDAVSMILKNGTADLMSIIFEAREEGARAALLDLAHSANISVRPGAATSEARRLILDALLGGEHLIHPSSLSPKEALRAAARAMGVSLVGSTTPGRKRALTRVRWAVWQALRDVGYSFPAIARMDVLGKANHTTVMSALGRIGEMSAASDEGRIMLAGVAAAREVLQPKENDHAPLPATA